MAKYNNTFKTENVRTLITSAFAAVSVSQWKNYCNHIMEVEDEMWRADNLQDDIDPLVIHLSAEESESADGSDSSSACSGVQPFE